jgi:hypothetical protein
VSSLAEVDLSDGVGTKAPRNVDEERYLNAVRRFKFDVFKGPSTRCRFSR